ncbi:MAG: hypothetical protein ABEJ87_05585 [Candidatus Nanohalobium sp.]
MADDFAGKASDFYMDLFTLEWKKLVLPVLMVLLLSASAFSTLSLRKNPDMNRRLDASVQTMTNVSVAFLETEYFNDSINLSRRELTRQITSKGDRMAKEATPSHFSQLAAAGKIQKIGIFPYAPELDTPVPAPRKKFFASIAVVGYRQESFSRLGKQLNSSSNISLKEFNSRVRDIISVSWKDSEVKAYLRNYSSNTSPGRAGGIDLPEKTRQQIIDEDIPELGFSSYIPALVATFLLYYVVNAVLVESGRKAMGGIRETSEPGSGESEDSGTGEEESSDEQEKA